MKHTILHSKSNLKNLLMFQMFAFKLGGPPIPVVVNLSIRSMGPVDESIHAFSLDCYFRQSWVDPRLKYNASGTTTQQISAIH